MSEVIDLTGDDTVLVSGNALPAPGRGRVPINNRQRERDRRRFKQRANRKKKRIATARARIEADRLRQLQGIPDIEPEECYMCYQVCTYKTIPRRWDFPMCSHWLCELCYINTLSLRHPLRPECGMCRLALPHREFGNRESGAISFVPPVYMPPVYFYDSSAPPSSTSEDDSEG